MDDPGMGEALMGNDGLTFTSLLPRWGVSVELTCWHHYSRGNVRGIACWRYYH